MHGVSPSEIPRRVTLRDVAQAAHVSVTTASEAIRGVSRVDDRTRDHVRKVATELGYRTDLRATAVRNAAAPRLVAFVTPIPDITRPLPKAYWLRSYFSLTQHLIAREVGHIMLPADRVTTLAEWPLDAVAWLRDPLGRDAELPDHVPFGMPIIGLGVPDTQRERFAVNVVEPTPVGFDAVTAHLREQGAHRIVFVTQDLPLVPVGIVRSLVESWTDESLPIEAIDISDLYPERVEELIKNGVDSFILMVDDTSSIVEQFVDGLITRGHSIPQDVMVVNWSEVAQEAASAFPLTNLSFQGALHGQLLADMIATGLRTGQFVAPTLPVQLNIRESSRRVAHS